jgi:hypothetical protein
MENSESKHTTLFGFIIYIIEHNKVSNFILVVLIASIVPMFAIIATGVILWSILHPTVEAVGPQGTLRLKMSAFSPDVYTVLVHPRGWQNTGILVSPNDQLHIRVYGQTNMGLDVVSILENSKKARSYIENVHNTIEKSHSTEAEVLSKMVYPSTSKQNYHHGWPWVGAEGYHSELPRLLGKIPSSFSSDKTLISNRYPIGRLLAYIGSDPTQSDDKRLIDFAVDYISIPENIENKAPLWLAVNDSILPEWQYDNFGFLMVTVEKQ